MVDQHGVVPFLHWMESPWDESEDGWERKWDLYLGEHLVSSRVSEWDTNEYIQQAVGVLARLIEEGLRG